MDIGQKCLLILALLGLFSMTSTTNSVNALSKLSKAIQRIELSHHLNYYPWLSPQGKRMAVLNAMYSDPELKKAMLEEPKLFNIGSCKKTDFTPFTCTPFGRRPDPPKSVHDLTPADIDVIGAIGDSLTAGTGVDACTVVGLLTQYRGRVFSIGGDDNVSKNPTLANILRLYNPNLVGFSVGTGDVNNDKSRLNVAHPGDNSLQLMGQAELLVQRMKAQLPGDEFAEKWKMVTIFIGNNDICDFCDSGAQDQFSPELFRQRLKVALDYLRVNLPRTLVNLVTLLDTVLVSKLNKGLACQALHYYSCKCAAYAKDIAAVTKFNDAYQASLYELIQTGRYDHDDLFTVVVQPFFQETDLPLNEDGSIDLTFFAPDCFHFSGKGHAATALALWNSLYEPVGQKKTSWVLTEPFNCPDQENFLIRTAKN